MVRHKLVDHGPRDTYLRGERRQFVRGVPARVLYLRRVRTQLATRVVGGKPDHERVWEGPGLAPKVRKVLHLDPDLLAYLPPYGLLDGLSGLDESGEHAVHPRRKARRAGKKHLVPALNEHDHGRAQARVEEHPAARTLFREFGRSLKGPRPVSPAEAVRPVPLDDLLRLARQEEEPLTYDPPQPAQVPKNHPPWGFGIGLKPGGPAPLPVQGSDVVPKGGAQPELLKGGRPGHAGRLFLVNEH